MAINIFTSSVLFLRYSALLRPAMAMAIKKNFVAGLGAGVVYFIIFCILGVAFLAGGYLYVNEPDTYSPGFVMNVSKKFILVFVAVSAVCVVN